MMTRRPPVWTTHIAAPGARAFAFLSGLEALTRSIIAAALPIQTQALFGSDESVSALTLAGSVAALAVALLIPRAALRVGRARLCALGVVLVGMASMLFMLHLASAQVLGFVLRAVGSVVFFSVVSMYIMDHVRRAQLGRSEPMRLLFIGLAWTFGPIAGVQIEAFWGAWAPFAASVGVSTLLLGYFLALRLGAGPVARVDTARVERVSLANLRVYMRHPRLVLAWVHAAGRGFFWNAFNLYAPLWAVQSGLGPVVGGLLVGVGSGFMLAMPLWGALARRFGIRRVSLFWFPLAAAGSLTCGLMSGWPWVAAGFLLLATLAMSNIDGYGNALFLRACKPSQRTELTPVFSMHRDFSEISQAAVFAVVLIFLPVKVVFVIAGLVLAGLAVLSLKINVRL
ncbi:MAG TPA: MFS transporter [Thermohalobaculum sp.]|nr:MFS transporter [Thermohalobaculum sp.]